ncbi:MAG: hypothetical protein ABIZ34_03500 [Candidatus Limnocylindrales bacterium]
MSVRGARRLSWALFAMAVSSAPVAPLVTVLEREPSNPLFALSFAVVQLSMASVGAFVSLRLPRHPIGWLLLAIGVGLGFRQSIGAYADLGNTSATGLPADDYAAWLVQWTFIPIVAGGVILLLHLFPDGQFISKRWRSIALLSEVIVLAVTASEALKPGHLQSIETVQNPIGATGWLADVVAAFNVISGFLAVIALVLAAVGMGVRVRRSSGIEREQIKWITFALGLIIFFLAGSAVLPSPLWWMSLLLALASLAAMPVAAGVAILRYRLYDIDVVINRTLVYGALTAMLAATYLGIVLLLQLALRTFTEGSGLAVAASTLATAALFRPLQARTQAVVDRRFFRSKYDSTRTIEAFGARLRDQVDLGEVDSDLRAVVSEALQPAHITLWLRERS